MEFTNARDPPRRRVPTRAEMLARFGQPVAVISTPDPDATLGISGGGVGDRVFCIDVDYRINHRFMARVRTIRELTPPPAHGARGDLLRSALIEFSANAELAAGATAADPDRPLGLQITLQQEQQAARASRADAQMTINGDIHDAVTLHIPGYRASLTRLGQTTAIYIGDDETPTPDLRTTTDPE